EGHESWISIVTAHYHNGSYHSHFTARGPATTSTHVTRGRSVGGCSRTFFSSLVQLIPCRAAVAPFSPVPPTESCCAAIVTLGRPCLCLLANGPPLSGIDRSMALQLPLTCSANFPPCDVIT
ncbi:unnamed protein product, partial [Brassica rapa]